MDRTQRSKRGVAAILLFSVVAIAVLAGCPPASLQTPEGKAAFTAGEVLQRVEELKAAAVQAHETLGADGQPVLATETTKRVLQFVLVAETALRDTPNGWRPAVTSAYQTLRAQLTDQEKQKLALPLSALDLAAGIVASTGGGR